MPNSTPSTKTLALAISGLDAGKFLQGQLTCDVLALGDGQSTLGAYCNIKGKVESLFTLHRIADTYQLQVQQDLLAGTLQELKKYAVFSKVNIDTIEITKTSRDEIQEILAKIPELYPATVGAFFPHDLNLPALGAVSFTKGCYRGQEIVARMEHRGNLKRRLYVFKAANMPVTPGTEIFAANAVNAGTVVRTAVVDAGLLGLAVITDTFADQKLLLNDQNIEIA